MLEVRSLRKAYGKTVAVEDVSFSAPRGVCYGLLGPNGAGKTTTIAILTGTLDADGGEVVVDGLPVGTHRLDAKRKIGYVPQDLALYEDLSAVDNLRFFGTLYGLGGRALDARVEACLAVAGLGDRRKGAVRTFSGGMKRRLNIAAALLHEPDLLVLDEPTVGVDPQSRNLIFEALEALLSQGKTLLYTTHYMEEVERLCKRAAIMDHGRVIAEGELADLHRLLPEERLVSIDVDRPLGRPLTGVPGVVSVRQDAPSLTLELEDLTRDLPKALEAVAAQGGRIENVRTRQPSLEDVFLHLTGRHLRD